MGELNLNNASASDLTNAITDYSVPSESTDANNEYTNSKFTQYLGYYKQIPELQAAIDAKATWTVGKGFKSDNETEVFLQGIVGWGKDTFNTILENLIRTYHIGGDAFAEIIRDKKGELVNLKPLDPSVIKIMANDKGIITEYEQASKGKKKPIKFKKEDILHLAKNRVADEIHGVSIIPAIEQIILSRNEAMAGYKQVMKRFMKPRYIFHLDTDDTTKIANFKEKMDKAWADGENIYVPKDAVVPEQMSIAPNSSLNPMAWIENLNKYFFQAVSVPQFIVGGGTGFTEASEKIAYLAFQQTIEEEQLFIEEQIGMQLGIAIELEFPASLENELLSDNKKDGAENIDPSETTAGQGQ